MALEFEFGTSSGESEALSLHGLAGTLRLCNARLFVGKDPHHKDIVFFDPMARAQLYHWQLDLKSSSWPLHLGGRKKIVEAVLVRR